MDRISFQYKGIRLEQKDSLQVRVISRMHVLLNRGSALKIKYFTSNNEKVSSMNKRLLIFGIALILHVSLFAGVVEKTYFFDTYYIEKKDGYQTIGFSNSLLSGKTGEPLLPYRAVTLLLPPGEVATLIEVSVENPTEISGVFKLYPRQPNRPVSEQKGGEFYINKTVYQMDSSYPQSSYGEWRTSYMNGYALMMTTITPLKYNPVRGKITFFRKMTVRVYTEPDDGSINALKNVSASDFAAGLVEKTVQNPDLLSLYPKKVRASDDYNLLIVTPAVFETGYQVLMDFYLCLLYTSPSPRDQRGSRMPSSA